MLDSVFCHVFAQRMGEVCRINARFFPPSYSIYDAKSDRACCIYTADKVGILATFGPERLALGGGEIGGYDRRGSIVCIIEDGVAVGIERLIFGGEGGG
jgi:hypothetical protein